VAIPKLKSLVCVGVTWGLSAVASAQALCFASAKPGTGIRLQLTLPVGGSQVGSVRYKHGSNDVLLRRVSEKVLDPKCPGPAAVAATFSELTGGRRAGEYVLTTVGGAVGDLVYVRQKDWKTYTLYEDLEATSGSNCEWAVQPHFGIESERPN
jgi:hypothetical protein